MKIHLFVGSVADKVQVPFLWRPCDHTPTLIIHVAASLDKAL